MHDFVDIVEFSLSILFAVLLAGSTMFALVRGRLYLGWRASVMYRERPGAFIGYLFLFAGVAVICAQEAFELTRHLAR